MVVNCEHVWQEISNYLEGDISPDLRAAMEAHFRECRHCTAILDGTRNIVHLYADDRLVELPAGFRQLRPRKTRLIFNQSRAFLSGRAGHRRSARHDG